MAPVPVPEPNIHGPEDRGPALVAMHSVWSVIAIAFMAARVRSRLMQHYLGIDDYCMLLSTTFFVVYTVFVIIISIHGGFKHLYYVDQDTRPFVIECYYIERSMNVSSLVFGKISIAFLLLRVLGMMEKWKKRLLYSFIALSIAIGIIFYFITFFQCTDPRALWNPAEFPNIKCWSPQVEVGWVMFTSSWFTLADFFLAFFPFLSIWHLNMGRKKKLVICSLLGSGTITGILSGLKTQQIYSMAKRSDLLWSSYGLFAFSGAELFLVICLGSIPAIKLLFDRYVSLLKRSSMYVNVRRMVARDNDSEPDENMKETAGVWTGLRSQHRFGAPNESIVSKIPRGPKTRAVHPLDISPSLLSGSGHDTHTSIHGGSEDESQSADNEESAGKSAPGEIRVTRSFQVV